MTIETLRQEASLSVGEETRLSARTPCGIFRAFNGNLYILTCDDYGEGCVKIAIVLSHTDLPKYSAMGLTKNPGERGRWLGPYRLRLTHALPNFESKPTPGTIGISERYVRIAARTSKRRTHWLPLGDVGEKGLDVCDYYDSPWPDFDGWSIEAIGSEEPFAEGMPTGERSWVLNVS